MIVSFLCFSLFIASIQSLPQGAPEKVCRLMLPVHGTPDVIQRQKDPSPFDVTARRNLLGALVTVKSPYDLPFEGFVLQARTPDGKIVGGFDPLPDLAHTMNCDGANGNSLTHTQPSKKNVLEAQWHSNGYEGPITFNATVAQDYSTFWVGIKSSPMDISKATAIDEQNLPPSPKLSSTTPPYFTPEDKSEASTEFDAFYDGCSVTKSCFGAPANCINSRNCKAALAVTVSGERYEFELKAPSAAWVGVGLSDDVQMGDDSVIECINDNGNVKAFMSWTSARPNLGVSRLSNPRNGIQLLESSLDDGSIYCRVQRDTRTIVNGRNFDLVNFQYYLLVAAGSSLRPTTVGFHDIAYLASGEKKFLSDVSTIVAASKILLRLHGAFMLAAWIGTASVGILLARYFRQTWVGTSLCGKDLWFAWHRFFMVTTWALTTAGFILIFVELKAWSTETNPHAILGMITTILCFIQPIGAYFRPHPGTSKRPIFNWLHWLGGNVAHILAIVTIFFAVRLNKAELPEWMDWILVAYVAFHVVIHVILSIMGCASERSAERRITSFPMKDLGGSGRTSAYSDRVGDAPYSTMRKVLLALYILIILVIVVVLIFISVVAPVEEFWENIKSSMQN